MAGSGSLGRTHVDKAGVLESASGEPVATAGVMELYDGSDLAAMSSEELKSLHTVELNGQEGAWSAYRVASVHKLQDGAIHFFLVDGTRLVVGSDGMTVLEPKSGEGSERLLGTVVGNHGSGPKFWSTITTVKGTETGNPEF